MNTGLDINQIVSLIREQGANLPGADAVSQLDGLGMVGIGIAIVLGLLNCFFGYKLFKVWVTVGGFGIGVAIGGAIVAQFSLPNVAVIAIAVVVGLLIGFLAFKLYLASVFLLCWFLGTIAGLLMLPDALNGWAILIVSLVIGLILGLLGLKFSVPMIIISTALSGGIQVADGIQRLKLLPVPQIALMAAGLVLGIIGMLFQFRWEGKKRSKKSAKKAEAIKDKVSVENDVEAARNIIDLDAEDDEETSTDEKENASKKTADKKVEKEAEKEVKKEELDTEDDDIKEINLDDFGGDRD